MRDSIFHLLKERYRDDKRPLSWLDFARMPMRRRAFDMSKNHWNLHGVFYCQV